MCRQKTLTQNVSAQIVLNERTLHIADYKQEANPRGLPPPSSLRLSLNQSMPQIPSLWRRSRGQGIRVAILDTGIDVNHPSLSQNIKSIVNFTNGIVDDVRDEEGHGTMIAGVIAANGNSIPLAGIAPEAELYIGKVIQHSNGGMPMALKNGIEWARSKQVHVINISLGSALPIEEVHQEIIAAGNEGIFVICAAGNAGTSRGLDFPARYDQCIAVGAVTRNNSRWTLSSNSGSAAGRELDIVAIGEQVTSTYPTYLDRSGISTRSGTSLATPFVTGVVALALAKHMQLGGDTPVNTKQRLTEHLLRTAIDLPPVGFDNLSGHGLINPERFLNS